MEGSESRAVILFLCLPCMLLLELQSTRTPYSNYSSRIFPILITFTGSGQKPPPPQGVRFKLQQRAQNLAGRRWRILGARGWVLLSHGLVRKLET